MQNRTAGMGKSPFGTMVRRHFDSVFTQHDFKVVCDTEIAEATHLVVFRCESFKIKITTRMGDLEFRVGPLAAPDTWSDSYQGHTVWHNPYVIADFMTEQRMPDESDLFPDRGVESRLDLLGRWAEWLTNNISLLAAFFCAEGFDVRHRGYDRYVEHVRRRVRVLLLEQQARAEP